MSASAPRRANVRLIRSPLSMAGATALDAIRVNGREAFLNKTFALIESIDPRERAVAEFMLRGIKELGL